MFEPRHETNNILHYYGFKCIIVIYYYYYTRRQIAVVLSKHENVVFTHIFSCYTMPGKSFAPFVQT